MGLSKRVITIVSHSRLLGRVVCRQGNICRSCWYAIFVAGVGVGE